MPSHNTDQWYRDQARQIGDCGESLDFDDIPLVSRNTDGDHGAYVACWIWIEDTPGQVEAAEESEAA